MERRIKIGIAGTHSTGKSTLISAVASAAETAGFKVGRISDLATQARDLGFPILKQHSADSSLWIMSEGLRQMAERSLSCDIILVDRPPLDALGYFRVALRQTERTVDPRRLRILEAIAKADAVDYDLLVVTVLDRTVTLGEGRDQDEEYRVAVGAEILALVADYAPSALKMTFDNQQEVVDAASAIIKAAAKAS